RWTARRPTRASTPSGRRTRRLGATRARPASSPTRSATTRPSARASIRSSRSSPAASPSSKARRASERSASAACPATSTSSSRSLLSRRRRRARRRVVQRLERARLSERIVTAEEQLALAADRVAEVLELEPVRVLWLDLDPLDTALAAELDHRHGAVPRIVEEERAFAADRLELVALDHRGAAV